MASPVVLLALFFLGTTVTSLPADLLLDDGVHPMPDYEMFPGLPNSSYKLHDRDPTSWGAAVQICQSEGAHLVVINNLVEAQAVFALFYRIPVSSMLMIEYLHIGIYDLLSEGIWHTVTGELVTDLEYFAWEWGRPMESTSENCGAINRGVQFKDRMCESTSFDDSPFICERNLIRN